MAGSQDSVQAYERFANSPMPEGTLAFYGLGQAGVIVRGPDGLICIDPYLSESDGKGGVKERSYPPPLQPSELRNLTAVLVTHEHLDHFDPVTLEGIHGASPGARFVGPHTCDFGKAAVPQESVLHPPVFEATDLGTARVTAVPSAHTELEPSPGGFPYLGFVIEWNGLTLYHSGDTVIYGEHEESGTPGLVETLSRWVIDVLFIPINGRDWFRTSRGIQGNTDAREAVLLAEELDVGLVIPTHYDLIPGNTVNPAHFVDILYRTNHARPHHLLRPGEVLLHAR